MKRLFVFFVSLIFIMCLVGCNKSKEKVTVDFIIDGESHLVQIDKGSSISKDIIPLSNKDEVVELYYDENMENKYNFENIECDTMFYIKFIDEDINQIILNNSYLIGIHTVVVIESLYSSSFKAISNDKFSIVFEEFLEGKKFTNSKERLEYVFENSFINNHFSLTFNGETPFSISILNDGTMILFINEKDIYISEINENINLNLLKERIK